MDLTQALLSGVGFTIAYIGIKVYTHLTETAQKQAENNKDNTPEWLKFAATTLKGFDAVLEALRGFSTRFDADSRERETIAREQVKLLANLSETVAALNTRIDAESAAIRQGHAENTVRLEALATIVTAVSETALETRKEFKIMSDETRTRAQIEADARQQQHSQVVETLTQHGLKLEQINNIVSSATVLNEGGLDELVGRLTSAVSADTVAKLLKAMADTQPIAPVQPDASAAIPNPIETSQETEPDDQP